MSEYLNFGRRLVGLDVVALLFFFATWVGYAYFATWRARTAPSLHSRMDDFRRQWFIQTLGRDNRMVDVNVVRNLTRSSQFFASTTLLILGALLALLGYVQKAIDVVRDLPFAVQMTERVFEGKILALICIYAYAFFKFSWSIRQFGFCSVLVAAMPKTPKDDLEAHAHVERLTRVLSFASSNFNNGLRAYYFSLAVLAWFLHPVLMMVAAVWVLFVLYTREFRSKTLQALVGEDFARRG